MKRLAILTSVLTIMLSGAIVAQDSDRDRGLDLYREGKFTEAIAALETAVTTNANDRIAWIFLGGGYIHADDMKKAHTAFQRSFEAARPIVAPPKYDRSVKVTNKPRPQYTQQARMNMSSGQVRVAVEFQADGKIGFIYPIDRVNDDLIRPSLVAAQQIEFQPAMKDGKPVTVINIVVYGYSIR